MQQYTQARCTPAPATLGWMCRALSKQLRARAYSLATSLYQLPSHTQDAACAAPFRSMTLFVRASAHDDRYSRCCMAQQDQMGRLQVACRQQLPGQAFCWLPIILNRKLSCDAQRIHPIQCSHMQTAGLQKWCSQMANILSKPNRPVDAQLQQSRCCATQTSWPYL